MENGYTNDARDKIDLEQFDDDFAEAEVDEDRGGEFEPIPDGKYQVNVESVELTRSRTSGNPMLKWALRVIAPRFRGRLLWRNNLLVSRDNIKWLKNDLNICGLRLKKLSDLPNHLDKLLDIQLEITKRTKGDFENVYFNRRILIDTQPQNHKGKSGSPDDIPF
jgi:hypothetical protein